jgi:hypothetical protein
MPRREQPSVDERRVCVRCDEIAAELLAALGSHGDGASTVDDDFGDRGPEPHLDSELAE